MYKGTGSFIESVFIKQRAVYIWGRPVKFAFFPADWYLAAFLPLTVFTEILRFAQDD